ncbi:FtsB family cell division protein [Bacillus suaedae]|uniref:Septum formation initiator family protein n=1 Tax=Halalkalibacter suaedae TaxID=2822140 RepID=A0A941AU26_9BACI|nr:septum formation initiator family protein [Bacillus suaedae]MBP3953474.1 septum formation initiator family protein [Bacillus suaedae]
MVTKRLSRVREMDNQYIQQKEMEMELTARRRRGLLRRLSVLAIIAVALTCLGFVTILSQVSTLEEKNQEKLALEEELESLGIEEKQLHEDIKNYNDTDYIAEIARRDYYLTRPGETLFKLPSKSTD